jgi:hypothetical protein
MIPGLLRTLLSIVLVWFVFRWLDRMFGNRNGNRNRNGGRNRNGDRNGNRGGGRKPDDNRVGEYVDYEEIDN